MTSFLVVEQVISEHRYAKPSIQSLSRPGSKPRPIMAGYPPSLPVYHSQYLYKPNSSSLAPVPFCSLYTPSRQGLIRVRPLPLEHSSSKAPVVTYPFQTLQPSPLSLLRALFPHYNLLYLKISKKKCLPHSIYPILLMERQQYPT